MRKELSLPICIFLLLATCLTLTSARASLSQRQAPTDAFVPGVFPWDPPVSNIGQAVNPTTDSFDYSVTLTIVKTVTKVSVTFSFPMQVTSVEALTEGWTVTFDGTTVSTTLVKNVNAGTTVKVTLRVVLAAGASFNFPAALATSADFNGNPEKQNFNFGTSSPLPPVVNPGSNNFISTAGQSYSTDGAGTHQFTFTFKAFRILSSLSVQFSFPNTNVLTATTTSAGATAAFQDGQVTVTYAAGVPADTVTTTVTVTTNGALTLPSKLTFTTGTQTQTFDFGDSTPAPTSAQQKPLGFSHINHGIKAGRSYLEVAYYLDITAGSDLESYYVQFTTPMAVSGAAGDATTTATLTDTNSVKLASSAPLAKGAKVTLTVYFKVASYSAVGLPAAIDFYYTVAGKAHHTKVKFN